MTKKRCDWRLFSFLDFSSPKLTIFSYQTKKNIGKKCGRPTGHNYGQPLDRKQTFFADSLSVYVALLYLNVGGGIPSFCPPLGTPRPYTMTAHAGNKQSPPAAGTHQGTCFSP